LFMLCASPESKKGKHVINYKSGRRERGTTRNGREKRNVNIQRGLTMRKREVGAPLKRRQRAMIFAELFNLTIKDNIIAYLG